METDPRVTAQYASGKEMTRLSSTPEGNLIRIRMWDVFHRFLPQAPARVLDVGGGPGIHAAQLARSGYEVAMIDPVPTHVDQARAISAAQAASGPVAQFEVKVGDARELPWDDASADVVLLLGPLYHLHEGADRAAALAEAARVLRPGGMLVAEGITRHSWLLDAAKHDLLGDEAIWDDIDVNITTGASRLVGPEGADSGEKGAFWSYLHTLDGLRDEVTAAGFVDPSLVAVEGWGWLLPDLETRVRKPATLLRALRLTETDPSMLGVSPHVLAIATTPT